MSKKYEARKIKTKRSYTFKEIADLLGLHIRTIQSWHTDGMLTLEGSNNPYLVMGTDVQNYIKQQKLKTYYLWQRLLLQSLIGQTLVEMILTAFFEQHPKSLNNHLQLR